jgi:two-component system, NarL family, response regulator DegU
MESSKIDICVVDDHHIFRKAVCQLVKTFSRTGEVTDAENGLKCLELVSKKQPDVVLLDLEMPVMNGVDCAEQLILKYPELKVIILTMHDNEKSILHMIEIGVHSFLLKNSDPTELERALYAVVDRDFYHNDLLVSVLRKGMRNQLKARRPDFSATNVLTEREQEVLRLICEDKTTKEIASMLGINEKTVHSHKLNVQTKLEVKTTVGMVRAAYEMGIIR